MDLEELDCYFDEEEKELMREASSDAAAIGLVRSWLPSGILVADAAIFEFVERTRANC